MGIVYKDELYIDILHIDTLYMDKWTCYTWNIKRITEFLPVGMFKASKGCRTNRVWDASPKVLRVYWDLPHGAGLAGGVIVLKVVGIDCITIKGYSGHSRCLINECLFKKKNPQFLLRQSMIQFNNQKLKSIFYYYIIRWGSRAIGLECLRELCLRFVCFTSSESSISTSEPHSRRRQDRKGVESMENGILVCCSLLSIVHSCDQTVILTFTFHQNIIHFKQRHHKS